jgi:hypothetical protein
MAQTGAERQAAMRARRRYQAVGAEAGEAAHQLNIFIRASAANALRRMARARGLSQRALLEGLLIEAEGKAVEGLTDAEIEGYYAA